MKYFITLLLILSTITGLQAKEIAVTNTDINNAELCEIFTGKVEDYAKYHHGDDYSEKTFKYFQERQNKHCGKHTS